MARPAGLTTASTFCARSFLSSFSSRKTFHAISARDALRPSGVMRDTNLVALAWRHPRSASESHSISEAQTVQTHVTTSQTFRLGVD